MVAYAALVLAVLGVFRDQLSFGEIPIKLYLHKRRRDDERDEIKTDTEMAEGVEDV